MQLVLEIMGYIVGSFVVAALVGHWIGSRFKHYEE